MIHSIPGGIILTAITDTIHHSPTDSVGTGVEGTVAIMADITVATMAATMVQAADSTIITIRLPGEDRPT